MLRLTVGQSLSLFVEPLLRGSWTDFSHRMECFCPSVLGSPRWQKCVCPLLWVTVFVGCSYLQEELIIFFNPMAPIPKDHSFLDGYQVPPLIFLVTATCTWGWIWIIGVMMTGENWCARGTTCPSVTLSTKNLTGTGLQSKPGSCGEVTRIIVIQSVTRSKRITPWS